MTERFFSDEFWHDPFVESLDSDGKLLYAYLFTSPHQNPSGVFQVTLKTIAFETSIDVGKLPQLIESFGDKVKWDKDKNQFWVKNFILHQAKNPRFLQSAINNIFLQVKDITLLKEYLDYYDTIGIWSRYGIDTVSLPSNPVLSCTVNNTVLSCPEKGDTQGGKENDFRKKYGHLLKGVK